jgi:hypothetical protein
LNPKDGLGTADLVFESLWHGDTSRGNGSRLEGGAVHEVDIRADIDKDDLGGGRGLAEESDEGRARNCTIYYATNAADTGFSATDELQNR